MLCGCVYVVVYIIQLRVVEHESDHHNALRGVRFRAEPQKYKIVQIRTCIKGLSATDTLHCSHALILHMNCRTKRRECVYFVCPKHSM